MQALGAVVILLVGKILAGIAKNLAGKSMARLKVDPTVTGFATNLLYWSVIVFAVIAALSNFGVQTTSFVAVLGAAGFAIGLAFQGTLANLSSGVMILLFRPFRVGDKIEGAGVSGVVEAIETFSTIIRSPENVKIIVPNGKLYGDVIKNHSAYTM
jgi:small conductance mechanosensitive channel